MQLFLTQELMLKFSGAGLHIRDNQSSLRFFGVLTNCSDLSLEELEVKDGGLSVGVDALQVENVGEVVDYHLMKGVD